MAAEVVATRFVVAARVVVATVVVAAGVVEAAGVVVAGVIVTGGVIAPVFRPRNSRATDAQQPCYRRGTAVLHTRCLLSRVITSDPFFQSPVLQSRFSRDEDAEQPLASAPRAYHG